MVTVPVSPVDCKGFPHIPLEMLQVRVAYFCKCHDAADEVLLADACQHLRANLKKELSPNIATLPLLAELPLQQCISLEYGAYL